MTIDIIRYHGATIDLLNYRLDRSNFWHKTYDLIILCIGGKDLAHDEVKPVFDKYCNLVRRFLTQTASISVCTVEYRLYDVDNRFGVDRQTYRTKVIRINPKTRHFISNLGHRYLDLGKTAFTHNRTTDRVHFNSLAQAKFCQYINREIRHYLRRP